MLLTLHLQLTSVWLGLAWPGRTWLLAAQLKQFTRSI